MSNAGIPLRVIQEISGHRNLEQLQRYLEVTDAQVLGVAAALSMLSPVGESLLTVKQASSKAPANRLTRGK
jgi:integrase/recombinase XerD